MTLVAFTAYVCLVNVNIMGVYMQCYVVFAVASLC